MGQAWSVADKMERVFIGEVLRRCQAWEGMGVWNLFKVLIPPLKKNEREGLEREGTILRNITQGNCILMDRWRQMRGNICLSNRLTAQKSTWYIYIFQFLFFSLTCWIDFLYHEFILNEEQMKNVCLKCTVIINNSCGISFCPAQRHCAYSMSFF